MAKAMTVPFAEGTAVVLSMRPEEAWVVLSTLVMWLAAPEPKGPMSGAIAEELVGLLRPMVAPEGSVHGALLAAVEKGVSGA